MNVLITGASSGLGKELVLHFTAGNHTVWPYDLKMGDDVNNPSSWMQDEIKELDLLINCAGINDNRWFEEIDAKDFFNVMSVNAFSIVQMTQAVLPALIAKKGTVVNIVSNAAHIPMTSSLSYNASKAAALMITKQMAHELTPRHGITVFSVSPNKLAGTGMSKAIEDNVCKVRGWTKEYAAEYQKKALMHGLESNPADVAAFIYNMVIWGQSQYMSGCDIPFGK